MLGFVKSLLGSKKPKLLVVEAYWCESPVKLSTKVTTPLGGKVTVLKVCVDIHFAIEDDRLVIHRVQLSGTGGGLLGSKSSVNVAAARRGEAWYARTVCSESLLREVVERELDSKDSRLRRIMFGKIRAANRGSLAESIVQAINDGAHKDVAELVSQGGKGAEITFTYTKPKGGSSTRTVSIQGTSGSNLRARDHKDDKIKTFRIENISNARTI